MKPIDLRNNVEGIINGILKPIEIRRIPEFSPQRGVIERRESVAAEFATRERDKGKRKE